MDETRPLLSDGTEDFYYENDGKHKILEFDPRGDPSNPLDWPKNFRWSVVLLLAFMAFTVTFTCVGIVPVSNSVILDLAGHKDKSATVLFVKLWVEPFPCLRHLLTITTDLSRFGS